MNASRIKTGIVGCGKVAHLHARALLGLAEADFVGVQSRTPERAHAFGKAYGVPVFATVEHLVHSGRAQVVLVCTPHPQHAGPAIEALEAGAHVLVEKPLASSVEDCDRMIGCARANRRSLGMISQRRLYPAVRRMHKAVAEGKIGHPALAVATLLGWRGEDYYASDPWRGSWSGEGGGVLLNQGSHLVDILQWIMGPIAEVSGYAANVNHPWIEVEDTVVSCVRFASGAVGSLVLSNSQKPALYGKIAVFGRNGGSIGVQTDGGEMFLPGQSGSVEPPRIDFWNVPGEEHLVGEWNAQDQKEFSSSDPTVLYHKLQIAEFLDAVRQTRDPMVTGDEGRKSVEIIQAIYRLQRERTERASAQ